MKKRKIYDAFIIFILLLPNLSFSQDLAKVEDGKFLKNSFRVNSHWKAVPDLVAVEVSKSDRPGSVKKISKTRKFDFVERSKQNGSTPRTIQALRSSIKSTEKSVVYNEERRTLGVLTGNLIIKVKQASDLQAVLADHGAIVIRSYENIGRAILKFETSENLQVKFLKLEQDQRIKSVDYEILTDKVEVH